MLSLQNLKNDIKFNTDLTDLLDVLKGVAVTEFRKQERVPPHDRAFMEMLISFIHLFDSSTSTHLLFQKKAKKLGLLLFFSEGSFTGDLNARILQKALQYETLFQKNPISQNENSTVMVLGEQGEKNIRSLGRDVLVFSKKAEESHESWISDLAENLISTAKEGGFDALAFVYPHANSMISQTVRVLEMLPFRAPSHMEQPSTDPFDAASREDCIQETPEKDLLDHLLTTWLEHNSRQILKRSHQAELSARAMHLEEGHQTLQEKNHKMKFSFARTYRKTIDKGIREAFAGQMITKLESKR